MGSKFVERLILSVVFFACMFVGMELKTQQPDTDTTGESAYTSPP